VIEQESGHLYDRSRGLQGSSINTSTMTEVVGRGRSFLVLAEGKVPGADRVLSWLVCGLHLEMCLSCH